MQAVILAGGLGTRLRSVIHDLPKPLAPVNARSFLERQMDMLIAAGFQQFVLCVGYRHELIETHLGDGATRGVRIVYSVESDPMGTAGALRLARPHLQDTFLVINGDTFWATDLAQLLQAHRTSGTAATIGLVHVPDAGRFGHVTLDDQSLITWFNEKGASGPGLINAGVYIFTGAAWDYFTDESPLSLEKQVLPAMVRRRLVRGCPLEGYHIDIGTPEGYAQFQEYVRRTESPRPEKGTST